MRIFMQKEKIMLLKSAFAKNTSRYALTYLFYNHQKGEAVATDGRILVRVPHKVKREKCIAKLFELCNNEFFIPAGEQALNFPDYSQLFPDTEKCSHIKTISEPKDFIVAMVKAGVGIDVFSYQKFIERALKFDYFEFYFTPDSDKKKGNPVYLKGKKAEILIMPISI